MTEGAHIACSMCGARPWPAELGHPASRSTFDLLSLDAEGRPSESPAPGAWRCELHRRPLGLGKYQLVDGEAAQ